MKILRNTADIKKFIKNIPSNIHIGLVPTMGSIHDGHLSLIEQSKKKECFTCASIFINPAQFNDLKDFKEYPKNEKKDLELLKGKGCELVFIPNVNQIYPNKIEIYKTVNKFRNIMCDIYRPNHFDGVTTVVKKLFDIIEPDYAFFGEKDFQQLKIIQELVKIKKIKTKIIPCDSIRDSNGMSLSSRYKLFNSNQTNKLKTVSRILNKTVINICNFKKIDKEITECMKELNKIKIIKIDYIEVRDKYSLKLKNEIKNSRFFVAFNIDNVRIIDNFKLIV